MAGGVKTQEFNSLKGKVAGLNETVEGLTKTVEGLNSTVARLLAQVQSLVTAQNQEPTLGRDEIERLVAQEIQAARSNTPPSAAHAARPAPAPHAITRGFFATKKQMQDCEERVENLLVG